MFNVRKFFLSYSQYVATNFISVLQFGVIVFDIHGSMNRQIFGQILNNTFSITSEVEISEHEIRCRSIDSVSVESL